MSANKRRQYTLFAYKMKVFIIDYKYRFFFCPEIRHMNCHENGCLIINISKHATNRIRDDFK